MSNKKAKKQKKPFVVVRTFSAGVHVGTLESKKGKEVVLSNARRVWRWKDANTLHEMARTGIDEIYSRISEPVESITLTEVTEIIMTTPEAAANLSRSRWGA